MAPGLLATQMCPPRTTLLSHGHCCSWLWCEASCWSNHRLLGNSVGPCPHGHHGLVRHCCGRCEQSRPPRSPRGKEAPSLGSHPSLSPSRQGAGPPQEPHSCQFCQSGTVWCWQPVPQPPGDHGGPRSPPGSLPRPRCTPLPSSGWLLPARRLGGQPSLCHFIPAMPECAPACPSMAPTDSEAALALLFLSPMAAALAWLQSRQHWGPKGTGGPVPVPSPAHVSAPGWAGVRGRGTGAANNSSPWAGYFSGRSCPSPAGQAAGGHGDTGTASPSPHPSHCFGTAGGTLK